MNGDQQSKLPGNSNRSHGDGEGAHGGGISDEEYEDVEDIGSGVEDDAPESFQALNRSEPPWATFPDLLRVPTSSNNTATEDDSPESLSFAAAHPFRPNDLIQTTSSGYRSTANPLNHIPSSPSSSLSSSSSNNHQVPFVGGIPKNRLSYPDVSHVDQSNSVSASNRSYYNPNRFSRQPQHSDSSSVSSSTFPSSNPRPLPALPANASSGRHHHHPQSNCRDENRSIAHGLHRNPINTLNLSSALYTSSQSSPAPPSLAHSLAPITTALNRVQSSVDSLSRQVNERLDSLENRLNNLTASPNDNCTVNSSGSVPNFNRFRDTSPESFKSFISEQKREMNNERRAFLISFAEALRSAVESSNRLSSSPSSEPSSTTKLNGL